MEDFLFNALPYLFVIVGIVLVTAVVWLLFYEPAAHERRQRQVNADPALEFVTDSEHLEQAFARLDELIRQAEAGDRNAQKVLDFGKHYGHRPQEPDWP